MLPRIVFTPSDHFPLLRDMCRNDALSNTGPERSVHSLAKMYQVMKDLFAGTNIKVILHDRVFVSILRIEVREKTTHENTPVLPATCSLLVLMQRLITLFC